MLCTLQHFIFNLGESICKNAHGRREVACVACARRTWNTPSRMVLRRLWDNRTPKEIAKVRARWQKVAARRGFREKQLCIQEMKKEYPDWQWDPHDEHQCFYETGGTGDEAAALRLREQAQRRIVEKLDPLRYCDSQHYPQGWRSNRPAWARKPATGLVA